MTEYEEAQQKAAQSWATLKAELATLDDEARKAQQRADSLRGRVQSAEAALGETVGRNQMRKVFVVDDGRVVTVEWGGVHGPHRIHLDEPVGR